MSKIVFSFVFKATGVIKVERVQVENLIRNRQLKLHRTCRRVYLTRPSSADVKAGRQGQVITSDHVTKINIWISQTGFGNKGGGQIQLRLKSLTTIIKGMFGRK